MLSLCCVLQPRRISAVSIAERVAQERCENLGLTSGYSVRFESVFPRPYSGILYCTVGEHCQWLHLVDLGVPLMSRVHCKQLPGSEFNSVHFRNLWRHRLLGEFVGGSRICTMQCYASTVYVGQNLFHDHNHICGTAKAIVMKFCAQVGYIKCQP